MATGPPALQDFIRDSFSARPHCAGISVCGQAFLLISNRKRSCYEEYGTLLAAFLTALVLTAPARASPQVVTLNVPGMTCPLCPITVKKALEKVQGVSKVDVRFEKKQVLVTFDDAKTNTDALVKATTDAGFPSQPDKTGK